MRRHLRGALRPGRQYGPVFGTAEAGKLPVTVYCSGAWTAQLTAESAWATLDRTAGSGITTIRLNYADNPGLTRSVGVVLRGSGLEKTVTVVQKAGITAPELIFLSKDLAFANGAYKGTAAFETNLPDELLRDVVPAVTYAAEGDAWISDVVYHADDEEAGETEIPLARRGLITFATAANATGEPRTATVGFSVTDADGNVFGDSFTVTQSADEARITLADDVAPIEGGRRAVAFSTNLGALLAEMKVEVTYADPAVADFISDVELGAGELTYAITANEGVEKRYATITVSCADLAGGVVSASSNITQRVTAQPAKCRPPICGRSSRPRTNPTPATRTISTTCCAASSATPGTRTWIRTSIRVPTASPPTRTTVRTTCRAWTAATASA